MFRLSLKRTLRNKKNYFLVMVLMVCFAITLCAFMIADNLNLQVETDKKLNVSFRTIIPNKSLDEETRKELKENPHVLVITSPKYLYTNMHTDDFIAQGYSGSIELILGSYGIAPDVILGDNLSDEETGTMICPYYFFPDGEDAFKTEKGYLNVKEYLNKEVTLISYSSMISDSGEETGENYHQKFKIIGFYDNTLSRNLGSVCYITQQDKTKIVQKLYGDIDESDQNWIVIDDGDNYQEIVDLLNNRGYRVERGAYHEPSFYADNQLIACLILIVSVFTSFMVVFNYSYKYILSNLKDYQLRTSLGYQKKDIVYEKNIEITILFLISFVLAILLYCFVVILANNLFREAFLILGMQLYFRFSILAMSIFLSLFLTFLCSMFFVWFYFGRQKSYEFLNR